LRRRGENVALCCAVLRRVARGRGRGATEYTEDTEREEGGEGRVASFCAGAVAVAGLGRLWQVRAGGWARWRCWRLAPVGEKRRRGGRGLVLADMERSTVMETPCCIAPSLLFDFSVVLGFCPS